MAELLNIRFASGVGSLATRPKLFAPLLTSRAQLLLMHLEALDDAPSSRLDVVAELLNIRSAGTGLGVSEVGEEEQAEEEQAHMRSFLDEISTQTLLEERGCILLFLSWRDRHLFSLCQGF